MTLEAFVSMITGLLFQHYDNLSWYSAKRAHLNHARTHLLR